MYQLLHEAFSSVPSGIPWKTNVFLLNLPCKSSTVASSVFVYLSLRVFGGHVAFGGRFLRYSDRRLVSCVFLIDNCLLESFLFSLSVLLLVAGIASFRQPSCMHFLFFKVDGVIMKN